MDWRDDVTGIVAALRPSTLLAVMPRDNALWDRLAQCVRNTQCRRVSGADLLAADSTMATGQLALVAGTLEYLDKRRAGNVIARLRDIYCAVLYVVVPVGDRWPGLVSHWENHELLAYGLRRARRYSVEGRPLCLYHYDIYDYKLTPDWLNTRHWSNPNRWDKARW